MANNANEAFQTWLIMLGASAVLLLPFEKSDKKLGCADAAGRMRSLTWIERYARNRDCWPGFWGPCYET